MTATIPSRAPTSVRHRPKTLTVFAAAFIAGAAVAVGVNRALDVHLAQSKPQVECEPIFVAIRSLPQGSPITVWDVALRDWPKAMVPSTALKSHDTFEGHLLRHPLREGQPLLSVQLMRAAASVTASAADPTMIEQSFAPPSPAPAAKDVGDASDSWLPGPTATASTGAERPARIAAGPQPEALQPTTAPATPTSDELTFNPPTPAEPSATSPQKPVDEKTTEAAGITPPVAAVPSTQPQLLPAIEPQAIPQPRPATPPQSDARTDVPDTVASSTPPSPELVPYPTSPAQQTPVPVAQTPSAPTPAADPNAPPEDPSSVGTTPPATAPSPVEPPVDAAASSPPTPELRTVLAQDQSSSPRAEPPAPQPTGESPNRYLVVPERIALQADVSFVNPQPREAVSDEPTAQDLPSTQQPSQAPRQPTRQTSREPQLQQPSSPKQPPSAGRLPGRSGPAVRSPAAPRASSGTPRPQPGPTPPATGRRPATATAPQTSMFPNIAAGIDALTGGFRRERDEQRTSQPR